MRLSIFYDHLREACQQQSMTMQQVLVKAKKAGIQGVEINLSCLLEQEEEILQLLKEQDMCISCIYEFYDWGNQPNATKVKQHIDAAVRVGAKKILVVPGFVTDEEAIELNAKSLVEDQLFLWMDSNHKINCMKEVLCQAVVYGKQQDVLVTLEDFDDKKAPYARMNQLYYFMKKVDGLRFTMDAGNFAYSDEDALTAYHKLKPYVVHVHCKDRGMEEHVTGHCYNKGLAAVPVGKGYMPIKEVVTDLIKSGYDDFLAIEHFGASNQLTYMIESAEFLHNLMQNV